MVTGRRLAGGLAAVNAGPVARRLEAAGAKAIDTDNRTRLIRVIAMAVDSSQIIEAGVALRDLGKNLVTGNDSGARLAPIHRPTERPDPRPATKSMSIEVLDPRFASVADGAGALERLASGAVWSEGPVWIREDASLLWSDIPNNRMLRWSADGGLSVWRDSVEFTNGHIREHDGALLHCSHGQRAIVRTRFAAAAAGSSLTVLADEVVVDRYQGRRFNSPNDIVVKSDATIWFTDPPYGILSNHEGHQANSELGDNYVFRFDPASGSLRIVSDWVDEPNGLAFSPDESLLYVSDTSAALRSDGGGNHHIVAFDVAGGQDLANPRIFAVVNPGLADGFRVDRMGFVYTSSADSVQVYHPDGSRIGRIAVPEKVGNLCFGGPAGNEMFICASTSLYRIRLNTSGLGLF
jgi:gluconolactonase